MQIEKDYPPLSLLLYLQSAPPDVIFSAFRQDCASKGIAWYSPESQNYVLEYCIRHPVSKRYPPRYSTLRSFLKQYITSLEDPDVTSAHVTDVDNDEHDPIHLELMEAYINLSVMNGNVDDNWCYKSFFNPYIERLRTTRKTDLKYLNVDGDDSDDVAEDKEQRREERRKEKKEILSMFCPLRVSCHQLNNVGYALWPAAFVMTQLMAQELVGTTRILASLLFPRRKKWGKEEENEPTLSTAQKLNVLELGAGAGLVPVLLHRIPAYRRHIATYTVTDYQSGIIENICYNLDENKVCRVSDYVAASRGLEGEKEAPYHLPSLLDWSQPESTRLLLTSTPVNLLLAADCVYDVEVIPDLVSTIKICLTEAHSDTMLSKSNRLVIGNATRRSSASRQEAAAAVGIAPKEKPIRVGVVVQTHRQNSTMKVFFDALKEFAVVKTYLLIRRPIGELRKRLSKGRDGKDFGIIPLGEWANTADSGPTVFEDEERIVCALMPDEVLSDGSLRSLRSVNSLITPEGTSTNPRTTTSTTSSSPRHPSIKSGNRGTTMTDTKISSQQATSSMGTLQAVDIEQLLKDDMIGPFYTSMAGLVAVHVVQLRSHLDEGEEEELARSARPPRAPGARRASEGSSLTDAPLLQSVERGDTSSTGSLPAIRSSDNAPSRRHSGSFLRRNKKK